ncbi:MAG: preprotein translocase subunit SecE [Acidobacteria bacterium]|nr:preprotein translocase subunit SecE [Acidobacteriota bacterium]
MNVSVKSVKASAQAPSKPAAAVPSWPARTSAYIEELKHEMRLVSWPSREQVRSTTVVVIFTVFFFGLYFGVVDYLLALGQTNLYGLFSN